jgi:hypothetical protein
MREPVDPKRYPSQLFEKLKPRVEAARSLRPIIVDIPFLLIA